MRCIVLQPMKHKGQRHEHGAPVTLSAKEAAELIASGTVAESTAETQEALALFEAKAKADAEAAAKAEAEAKAKADAEAAAKAEAEVKAAADAKKGSAK